MEKKRDSIIAAALEVFEEYGYAKAKVNDITEKANVGYGTFYQYFKNKQALLTFLSEEMSNHIGDYIYLKTHKNLDLKKKLYYGVLDILNFYLKYQTIFLILAEAAVSDKTFIESEKRIQKSLFERIARDISYFIKKGYCRKSVGEMTIFAICYMIDGYAKQMIRLPKEEIDTAEIAQVLSELSYDALFDVDKLIKSDNNPN
jgi:AcrR family transcriptional regulator